MTPDGFDRQMKRLIEVYGAKAYPQARANLFWNEFKAEPDSRFERVVTTLIGERITPPMMSHFRDEFAKVRERCVEVEKKQQARDAEALWDKESLARYLYHLCLSKDPENVAAFRWWLVNFGQKFVDVRVERGRELALKEGTK